MAEKFQVVYGDCEIDVLEADSMDQVIKHISHSLDVVKLD